MVLSYQVCKSCFDVGPQRDGAFRSLWEEFNHFRNLTKSRKNNNDHKDGSGHLVTHIKEELQRLVDGYTKHIGLSKLKSFVSETFSFVKIPDWQRSKHWMVRS